MTVACEQGLASWLLGWNVLSKVICRGVGAGEGGLEGGRRRAQGHVTLIPAVVLRRVSRRSSLGAASGSLSWGVWSPAEGWVGEWGAGRGMDDLRRPPALGSSRLIKSVCAARMQAEFLWVGAGSVMLRGHVAHEPHG